MVENPLFGLSEADKNVITEIESDLKRIENLIKQLNIQDGWNVEQVGGEGNGVIKYQKMPGTSIVTVKIESELKVPLFNLCALIYEIDLFTEWVPFCDRAQTIKVTGQCEKLAFVHLGFPVISNRETYLHGIGVDRLQHNGTIIIMARSIQKDKAFLKKHDVKIEPSKSVDLDLHFFLAEIRPLSREKSTFNIICNGDPNVNFLPQWFMNFMTRKVGSMIFGRIINNAQTFKGSQYQANTKKEENKEFYGWLQWRIDQYYEELEQQKQ